jgi:hypothetical protein
LFSPAVLRLIALVHRPRRYAPALLATLAFGACIVGHASSAWCDKTIPAAQSEPVPTFRASDLLVLDVLRGPNYQIDEFVQVQKYKYLFQINTEWGVVPAEGLNMLELRLREMHAIENLRQLAKDAQFVQGIVEAVRSSPQGWKLLLTTPQGASLRVGGANPTPRSKVDPTDRRAGSETRRRLAVEVGCDPETANPILRGLLDGLQDRKGLGTLTAKSSLSATAPGLTLLATTPELKELIATKSPHALNIQIYHDLEALAIPAKLCEQFTRDVNYTTTQRLLFVQYLRPLREVKNLPVLVEGAVDSANESEGLAVLQQLKLLNELHQRDPIRELSRARVPLALTQSGVLVAVSASDYIIHSTDLAAAISEYRREHPKVPLILYTAGKVSVQGKKDFAAAKIQVQER